VSDDRNELDTGFGGGRATMIGLRSTVVLLLVAAGLAGSVPVLAGANFSEDFENVGPTIGAGPQNLTNQGWIFRNQSQPAGVTVWRQGVSYQFPYFTPHTGSGYLSNYSSWDDGNRNVSAWAILPALPGQAAGDQISFYIAGAVTTTNHLEVRYSPSGGTSTGVSLTDVGDFTQVLTEGQFPPNIGDWALVQTTIPGAGRLAIRWFDPQFGSFQSPFIALDTLLVGPPPCNSPPIPDAGQTVTWGAVDSPYEVCGDVTIPAGATVNIEPGVAVTVDAGFSITINGTLQGVATAGQPITLNANANFPAMLALQGGTVDLQFANIGGQIRPYSGATLMLTDCTFSGLGLIWSNGTDSGPLQYIQPYVLLERCTFDGTGATLTDSVTTLRQTTVSGGAISVLRGYVDTIGGVTVTGGVLSVSDEAQIQPVYVDSVTATGQAGGAGLVLAGANFALGPNNVLQNNLYPVEVRGGVWPGSIVPTIGNTNNRIYFGGSGAQTYYARWANVGVPYRVDSFIDTPPLLIEPGCTVEFTPDAFFRFVAGSPLLALGQLDAPVTFKAALPGQPWDVIIFGSSANTGRLEYCTIQEANIGVVVSDALIWLDNVMFQNNATGANANTFGELVLRKSRFAGNGAGISFDDNGGLSMNAPGNPNSFEGNGAGIQTLGFSTQADARNNWWNSPSGPQSPLNPGGTGDAITGPGASGVQVVPFLTAQPDFSNHPPVIRLVQPSYLLTVVDAARYFDPGQKVVLRWSASDDDTIVSQRVLVSPAGNWPSAFTISFDVPPDARTYELTVPSVGFDASSSRQFIRVVATDSHGQEGWDEIPCVISSERLQGTVTLDVPAAGQTFYAGDAFPPYTRTVTGFDGWFPSFDDYLTYEADGSIFSSGGPVGQLPNVSTDLARYWTKVYNNSNDVRWFPGPYITIRHDPRLGFQPPTVQLQTPAAGSSYVGGSVVPITWTATAGEGLRSFDIQASTDGGNFWRILVKDLPAGTTQYDWQLPTSDAGIPDVRVRVIARDLRFQNSSATSGAFAILPGTGVLPGDLNCDGVVNFGDINPFVLYLSNFASWQAAYPGCPSENGDINGDGTYPSFADINPFVALLTAG
jgi:hypothetical protein